MKRHKAVFVGNNVFLTKATRYSYEVRDMKKCLLVVTITASRADCLRIVEEIDGIDFNDLAQAKKDVTTIMQNEIERKRLTRKEV